MVIVLPSAVLRATELPHFSWRCHASTTACGRPVPMEPAADDKPESLRPAAAEAPFHPLQFEANAPRSLVSDSAVSPFVTPRSACSTDVEDDLRKFSSSFATSTDEGSSDAVTTDTEFSDAADQNGDDEHTDEFAPRSFDSGKSGGLTHTPQFLLQFRGLAEASATPCLRYTVQTVGDSAEGILAPTRCSSEASRSSWIAQRQRQQSGKDPFDQQNLRAVRSLLNKLTMERFDTLYENIMETCVKTTENIIHLVQEIVDRATVQHNFIGMYVELCFRIGSDSRLKTMATGSDVDLRRVLLEQCQRSFEYHLRAPSKTRECNDGDEDRTEEARVKRKQRALGNAKLIGQLLVRGMLSTNILVTYCEECLASRMSCSGALESLVALLVVAGPSLDGKLGCVLQPRLDKIFYCISELARGAELPSRERFLVQDLLEIRRARWIDDRRATTEAPGPMRLEEVRECASAAMRRPRPDLVSVPGMPEIRGLGTGATSASAGSVCCSGGARGAKEQCSQRILDVMTKPNSRKQVDPSHAVEFGTSRSSDPRRARRYDGRWVAASAACNKGRGGSSASRSSQPEGRVPGASHQSAKLARGSEQDGLTDVDVASASRQEAIPSESLDIRPAEMLALENSNAVAADAVGPPVTFDRVLFQRELVAILRELASNLDVAAAVRRVRKMRVPEESQSVEIANLLTRAAEESRGPARRSAIAFTAALAKGDQSAFSRNHCLLGIRSFFEDDYADLCDEIPRLRAIVSSEFVPTLLSVFTAAELVGVIPVDGETR